MSLIVQQDRVECDKTCEILARNLELFWSENLGATTDTEKFFIKYDISEAWEMDEEKEEDDLIFTWATELNNAIKSNVGVNERLNSVDYQHKCYSYFPHKNPNDEKIGHWFFPDGDDYYLFPDDFRWCVISLFMDRSLTIIGKSVYDQISRSSHKLFQKPIVKK